MIESARREPPTELRRSWLARGLWTDDTFPELTAGGLVRNGGARVSIRSSARPFEGTVAGVADQGARLAGWLSARGVRPGDVVAFQLPNWAEAAACFWGLLRMGVVLVPVVHIYGRREVGHILRESGAKALVTADRFGHQDFAANLESLAGDLPDLELVVVVDAHGRVPTLGAETVTWSRVLAAADPIVELARVDPDDPLLIGYTSGTTAAPKGVVHTHRTLLAEMRQFASFQAEDRSGPRTVIPAGSLSAAPVSHITGLLGVLAPLLAGTPLHLLDRWDPALVLRAIAEERLSAGTGSTFFLTSLLDHPDFEPAVHAPVMGRVMMGGSPVPSEVAERAVALGISVVRAYGSTEHPSTTACVHSDPLDKRLRTDGRPLPGVELRIVGEDGRDLPPGSAGEIVSRGPDLFVGYTDEALTEAATSADGWYWSGDVGVLDDDGYLRVTDRKKDVIIRGGENISAAEIEQALQAMPGVSEVAVVAAPDRRYGEHACAVVQLAPGAEAFELDALRRHLDAAGLARHKWPEDLRFVEELPRTASGKVQKFVLRDQLGTGR